MMELRVEHLCKRYSENAVLDDISFTARVGVTRLLGPSGIGKTTLRGVYLPQVLPYFRSAVSAALGLCWKAGTAAEVIALSSGSIGEKLYNAKIYFQTADLFAWTAAIVLISAAFEKLFLLLVDKIAERMGA